MSLSASPGLSQDRLYELNESRDSLGTYRIISTKSPDNDLSVYKVRQYLDSLRKKEKKEERVFYYSPEDQKKKDLFETKFGYPLEKIPSYCMGYVNNFKTYLNETKNFSFEVHGYDDNEGNTVHKIPYVHRWTDIYRKSILAKLYQLEAYLGDNINECTMITLTTFQRGLTFEKALKKLMTSYTLLQKTLFKLNGTVDFFYVLEPHKSGYAHMHLLYFKLLSDAEKERITDLWAYKYHTGSKRHGINFSEARASYDGNFASGSIGKVRSYLMKYISKGVCSESWSIAELVFNATLKKTGVRLWNCSRNYSKIMARPAKDKNPDWQCTSVYQLDEKKPDEKFLLWDCVNGMRSDKKTIWRFANSSSIKPDLEKLKQKNRICIPKRVVDSKGKPYTSYVVYEKKEVSIQNIKEGDIDAVPRGLLSNKDLKYSRNELRKLYRNILSIPLIKD